MSIETFKGIKPKISKSAFVHESAVIIGDVSIGDNSSIWPNCVIRGDVQKSLLVIEPMYKMGLFFMLQVTQSTAKVEFH